MERDLFSMWHDGDESQFEELPVMLAEFHHLTDDEFCAYFASLKCDARRRIDDRAQKYAGHKFTPADAPASLRQILPLDRASAGTHFEEIA